jgi:hypothetical protein
MTLLAVAAVALVGSGGSVNGEPPARAAKDHDFGDIVLYVVTKKDAKGEHGYGLYEKPRVVWLGDRAFIVGAVPDYGEGEADKVAAGKKVWTPVSEVVQMTEFKTVAEAKRYFEGARKNTDKLER